MNETHYVVNFSRSALKQLERISEPYYTNIKNVIVNLAKDPRPQGYIKLKGRDGYRVRVGDYRIIYDIFDSQLVVEIITLGHRRDIYS